MSELMLDDVPAPVEHRIPRDRGSLHVRDFAGAAPVFVLMHGFPDNSRIYDLLIPHLVKAGRRVVTVDFMGFGASDKVENGVYSFRQQLGDLEAVVDTLALEAIVAVGHDAGGPAAVNFSLAHPDVTSSVILMNAFYGDAPGLRVPELIELFSNKRLRALQQQFLRSPQQFAWLLEFQRGLMTSDAAEEGRSRYTDFLGGVIDDNFRQQPSAGPAFAQMTYQLSDELASNDACMVDFSRSQVPLKLIWGARDPYLQVSIAEHLRARARHAVLHAVDAGHWPQIDATVEVARIMLERG